MRKSPQLSTRPRTTQQTATTSENSHRIYLSSTHLRKNASICKTPPKKPSTRKAPALGKTYWAFWKKASGVTSHFLFRLAAARRRFVTLPRPAVLPSCWPARWLPYTDPPLPIVIVYSTPFFLSKMLTYIEQIMEFLISKANIGIYGLLRTWVSERRDD